MTGLETAASLGQLICFSVESLVRCGGSKAIYPRARSPAHLGIAAVTDIDEYTTYTALELLHCVERVDCHKALSLPIWVKRVIICTMPVQATAG